MVKLGLTGSVLLCYELRAGNMDKCEQHSHSYSSLNVQNTVNSATEECLAEISHGMIALQLKHLCREHRGVLIEF